MLRASKQNVGVLDRVAHLVPDTIRHSELLRRALWWAIAVIVVAQLVGLFLWGLPREWAHPSRERDAIAYYRAAAQALRGEALYVSRPGWGPHLTPHGYLYPPPFAAAAAPLGRLSYEDFMRVWYIIVVAAFWLYAWSLAKLYLGRASLLGVLVAAAIISRLTYGDALLVLGQAEVLVWALFGLALTTRGTGAALAAAVLIKPHAFWALLVACQRERGRVLWPALCVGTAAFLLGWAVCGLHAYPEWARSIAPLSQGTFFWVNVSPPMAVLRLARWLGLWHYAGGPLGPGPRLFLAICALAGPLAIWWLTRRCSPRLQYACVGVAAILSSPLCWLYYLTLTALPVAIWLGERRAAAYAGTCR